MSAQTYTSPDALARMGAGLCPECGLLPATHSNDPRFWMPRTCDLLTVGVVERIAQYEADLS